MLIWKAYVFNTEAFSLESVIVPKTAPEAFPTLQAVSLIFFVSMNNWNVVFRPFLRKKRLMLRQQICFLKKYSFSKEFTFFLRFL
jgi:hypothetical protein